jgi:glycosyltransferase involved in cell wall biosynthesis
MSGLAQSERRPRIAITSEAYPPDHRSFRGGVATATAALLEGLQGYVDDFEFHLVTASRAVSSDRRETRNGMVFHFLRLPSRAWLRPRLAFAVVKIYRELRGIHPDLVHTEGGLGGSLAASLAGFEHLHTVHGFNKKEALLKRGWDLLATSTGIPLQALVLRNADAVVFISSYTARQMASPGQAFWIPNAASGKFFRTVRQKESREPPYLLFAGVLTPRKRPMDLLLAYRQLRLEFPNLEVLFCGGVEDARYARCMRELAAREHLGGARFLGPLPPADIAELMSRATALVLPSAEENAPMVIAEAMAIGIPVVATRVGGVSDMVTHGETGLLYESGNVDALVECLRSLLIDSSARARLGDLARGRAQAAYAPERVADATVMAYSALLMKHATAATGGSVPDPDRLNATWL